ncbi:MAG TPA: TetR/AcrR family transcriptional regulator [Mobilitalea sp.]|nr:TetR/AcrR family transcriptional regulator [Mobilitalea sp.]
MNTPNARERILNTAVKIFAEKSYEGSRIDEIAKAANVPKSLIYYHFKSKDEILQVLIDNFIKEYMELIGDTVDENHQEKAEELPGRMRSRYHEFGQKNADLVRVILIDSLKKTKEKPVLFQIIDAMIAKETQHQRDENYDIQERRIAEFFTSFMPNYAYLCFADAWTQYFQVDRKRFDQLYLKVYEETHGAYHKNHD